MTYLQEDIDMILPLFRILYVFSLSFKQYKPKFQFGLTFKYCCIQFTFSCNGLSYTFFLGLNQLLRKKYYISKSCI